MAESVNSIANTGGRRVFLVLAFALLASSAIAWWVWPRHSASPLDDKPPPDPRLSYAGPFLNIHPDIRYVGDAMCIDCHRDISKTYAQHPMGRTMSDSRDLTPTQGLTAKQNHPIVVGDFRYRVVADKGKMTHRVEQLDAKGEAVLTQDYAVRYRIGSGSHGHSYLTESDGRIFQTPISWFSSKNIWDISPMFEPFTPKLRPIGAACLFCHSNRLRMDETQSDRFQPGVFDGLSIGCERCHGPGEKHVAARERGDTIPHDDPYDKTIVNPRRLSWQLRENVCEQCHLEGRTRIRPRGRDTFDYRPGMPLEQFLSIFVDADPAIEEFTAVNHVEQMYRSKCFQKSPGEKKLGCISCHNPHEKAEPAQRIASFRKKCMECHTEASCTEPRPARLLVSPQDSCIDCHMPRHSSSDVAHTAATDHRIVRRPMPPKPGGHGLPHDLALFHRDRIDPTEPGRKRDLAVALASLLTHSTSEAGDLSKKAIELLTGYFDTHPGDADAWQALGLSLVFQGRTGEAANAFATQRRLRPKSESALRGVAFVAQSKGEWDVAVGLWREAVAINPSNTSHREKLADALQKSKDAQGELDQVQHWLRLEPFSVTARRRELEVLSRLGRRQDIEDRLGLMRRLRIRPEQQPR